MAGRAYQMSWGPYFGQAEASVHLSRFADATVGRETGILFSDGQTCMVLRQPVLDADGLGHSMIARWMPAPAGADARIDAADRERVRTGDDDGGRGAIARAQGEMALGQALARFLGSETGEHAVGMAFDLLGLLAAALLLFVPGVARRKSAFSRQVPEAWPEPAPCSARSSTARPRPTSGATARRRRRCRCWHWCWPCRTCRSADGDAAGPAERPAGAR